jgi:hypothetical protein
MTVGDEEFVMKTKANLGAMAIGHGFMPYLKIIGHFMFQQS